MSSGSGRGRKPGAPRGVAGPGARAGHGRGGRPPAGRNPDRGPAGQAGRTDPAAGRRDPAGRDAAPGRRPLASDVDAGARRWRLVRAGHDAVPPSARRFMRRARRRRLRAALPWAVVAGGAALATLAAWVVLGTGVFGVREVRVTGAELVSTAEVRAAAAVPDGIPLARVDLPGVRRRVATLAPVGQVTVHRAWPDAVQIDVVERTPALVVPQGDRFAVLDPTGVVFQTVPQRPADLPLARIGAPGPADVTTRATLQVLGSLTPELRQQLTEVVAEGPARIKLLLRGGRTVIWGDASLGDTKARVATSLLARAGATIDVSAPDVVTIR